MAAKSKMERRKFLKGGMLAGAAAIAQPKAVMAQQSPSASEEAEVLITDSCGSDYMVDVIKSLGFEYVCANPGSSFRGMQESIINYGGNRNPEFITNCHEESSVAMAHGYFKIEGKPMAVLAHGTVGLQHASMAIYNAWWPATTWTPRSAGPQSGTTVSRIVRGSSATSRNGTISRPR